VAGAISLVVTVAIALVVYRLVERPGIALGKRIVTRLRGGAAPLGMAIGPSA
jgi:peptidoglycan/LPS O-acetylase OafA/YrhL